MSYTSTMRAAALALFVISACSTSSQSQDPNGPVTAPPLVEPPTIQCTAATDAAASLSTLDPCAAPPSVCADGYWLAYFDHGECLDGRCLLVTKYFYCQTGCDHGSCISNHPTAPSRFGKLITRPSGSRAG